MGKYRTNKCCRKKGTNRQEQPWFKRRRARNRVRDRMAKESRRRNRR